MTAAFSDNIELTQLLIRILLDRNDLIVTKSMSQLQKTNLFGKWAFISETNSQQANWLAHYGIMGFGFNFFEDTVEKIKKVTSQDIKECAAKYFNDKYTLTILKP